MPEWPQRGRALALGAAAVMLGGCPVQLVSPYNSDLQQRASAMQAEVGTWDLAMYAAAGSIAADPRHPDVIATLDKWRGEADAMLTLSVSNDPGLVKCAAAVRAIHEAILEALPADLRAAQQATPAGSASATATGCESSLAARLPAAIEEVRADVTAGCKLNWISDAWFTSLAGNRAAAPRVPAAPAAADQAAVTNSCRFEFGAPTLPPTNAAGSAHGVAVSRLLTLLQEIVYIETRKKAATAAK